MTAHVTRAVMILLSATTFCFAAEVRWDGQTNDNWQIGSNWNFRCLPVGCGQFVPAPGDDVILMDTTFGTSAMLSADVSIQSLTIGNGMDVNTNGFALTATGGSAFPTLVDGTSSTLLLAAHASANTTGRLGRFELTNGGRISLSGTRMYASHSGSRIGPGSSLGGFGSVDIDNVDGNPSQKVLINDGTIVAAFGHLSLTAFGGNPFDLDGDLGNGVIDADDGTFFATSLLLHIDGPLSDPFDGTMQIGEQDTVRITEPWQLGSTGTGSGLVQMNGRDTYAAIDGADVTVRGTNTLIDIQSGRALLWPHLDVSQAVLRAHEDTIVDFTGGAFFAADATFETASGYSLWVRQGALVEINQSTFDWDGPASGHTTWIDEGHLRINSNHVDTFNSFDGTIRLVEGTLEVNTLNEWRMNSTMDLEGVFAPASIIGQKLVIGNDNDDGVGDATVNVEGFLPRIHADVQFNSDSKVNFATLALLNVFGNTSIDAGATFQGDGALVNQGTMDLQHGAVVGVDLDNRGLVTLGTTAVSGHAQVDEFRQQANGQLSVKLRSASLGIHDRLDVVGTANLDGELSAVNTGATLPTFGDSYTILNAASVVGEFSETGNFPSVVPGARWRVLYGPNTVTLAVTASGDLNSDGFFDCTDVDSLVAEIVAGTNAISFDLTGDGWVDEADLTQWLADAGAVNLASGNPFLVGDANLDGAVNGQDFVIWNTHKFSNEAAWCKGDFNADGAVNGQDFVLWNANKFMSADALSSVPEPRLLGAYALAALVGVWTARRTHVTE